MNKVCVPASGEPLSTPQPISLREAFWFWLKLGFISFGGPAGQISIMHQELVERRRWISERRFLHALNYCMLLPGPEAQQLATYIGWLHAPNLGRGDCRRTVRAAFAVHPDRAVMDVHRLRRSAGGGRDFLRDQTRRDRDCGPGGASHRLAGIEEQLAVGDCGSLIYCDLRAQCAVSADRPGRSSDRLRRRAPGTREVQSRRPQRRKKILRPGVDRRRHAST